MDSPSPAFDLLEESRDSSGDARSALGACRRAPSPFIYTRSSKSFGLRDERKPFTPKYDIDNPFTRAGHSVAKLIRPISLAALRKVPGSHQFEPGEISGAVKQAYSKSLSLGPYRTTQGKKESTEVGEGYSLRERQNLEGTHQAAVLTSPNTDFFCYPTNTGGDTSFLYSTRSLKPGLLYKKQLINKKLNLSDGPFVDRGFQQKPMVRPLNVDLLQHQRKLLNRPKLIPAFDTTKTDILIPKPSHLGFDEKRNDDRRPSQGVPVPNLHFRVHPLLFKPKETRHILQTHASQTSTSADADDSETSLLVQPKAVHNGMKEVLESFKHEISEKSTVSQEMDVQFVDRISTQSRTGFRNVLKVNGRAQIQYAVSVRHPNFQRSLPIKCPAASCDKEISVVSVSFERECKESINEEPLCLAKCNIERMKDEAVLQSVATSSDDKTLNVEECSKGTFRNRAVPLHEHLLCEPPKLVEMDSGNGTDEEDVVKKKPIESQSVLVGTEQDEKSESSAEVESNDEGRDSETEDEESQSNEEAVATTSDDACNSTDHEISDTEQACCYLSDREISTKQGDEKGKLRKDLASHVTAQHQSLKNTAPKSPSTHSVLSFGCTSVESLPWEFRRLLRWRASMLTPAVVRQALMRSGFRVSKLTSASEDLETIESSDWIFYFGKHMRPQVFRTIREHQKVNHLPCSFQLGRKDRLWKNLVHMQQRCGKENYNYMPQTFCLPADLEALKKVWDEEGPNQRWILKPPASARGIGVRLITKWAQVPKKRPAIVQRYLSRPYLINDSKFDLRIYVYISSVNPLRVYIHEDGLVRFASQKYTNSLRCIGNRFIHLTNYSINRLNSEYVSNTNEMATKGHKWSLRALWAYFRSQGISPTPVWSSIKDVVVKTAISTEAAFNAAVNTYCNYPCSVHEVFGFDIFLDEDLTPWLLEVNVSPSMHSDSPLDAKIKGNMVRDMLNIAGLHIPEPSETNSHTVIPSCLTKIATHKSPGDSPSAQMDGNGAIITAPPTPLSGSQTNLNETDHVQERMKSSGDVENPPMKSLKKPKPPTHEWLMDSRLNIHYLSQDEREKRRFYVLRAIQYELPRSGSTTLASTNCNSTVGANERDYGSCASLNYGHRAKRTTTSQMKYQPAEELTDDDSLSSSPSESEVESGASSPQLSLDDHKPVTEDQNNSSLKAARSMGIGPSSPDLKSHRGIKAREIFPKPPALPRDRFSSKSSFGTPTEQLRIPQTPELVFDLLHRPATHPANSPLYVAKILFPAYVWHAQPPIFLSALHPPICAFL
ncbi:unnamed protein product [Calicophoron daubneyi]|uniref:Tubulin polyglutamylase TTLL4 n=1 Tax=Calicophoron daubneyi TaxID=300641 RepID=A0AAV2TFZ4_CALDB